MKVFVGLSGGVDSAVAAAQLVRAGAQVTGVFIQGWYPPGLPCSWAEDRRDAMRVAARINIPFHTLDASGEYKRSVIEYLVSEYRSGRTPNPDIMCNREIKFGVFHRYAESHGARIATGHYRSGKKDQRYFLWAVPKSILQSTLFPLDGMEKPRVRTLAKRYHLPVALKKDSQGVCFLGPVSLEEFLRTEFGNHPGRAFDESGSVIGMHDGAMLYTIGERIGLHAASEAGPWFVRSKDIENNEIVVGKSTERQKEHALDAIRFDSANWFTDSNLVTEAQVRYRGPRISGYVQGDHFFPSTAPVDIPTPGQSIVFYANDELVGGGIIAS